MEARSWTQCSAGIGGRGRGRRYGGSVLQGRRRTVVRLGRHTAEAEALSGNDNGVGTGPSARPGAVRRRRDVRYPAGILGSGRQGGHLQECAWSSPHPARPGAHPCAPRGVESAEVDASRRVGEDSLAHIGATGMGRNMFGGHPGAWDAKKPWNGWWGVNPPFHHPVFVLTHHPREPIELEGGTTFTFVTQGIEAALEQARRAADGNDVSLAGGANAAQQYLAAGLVDEMEINLVPTLLGRGERLFDRVGDDLHGLELVRTVAAPSGTHLKLARR